MASDLPATQINGINLDNYIPSRRSYNSVVYVHKKFFNQNSSSKDKGLPAPESHENTNLESKHKEIKKKSKCSTTKDNKGCKTEKDLEQTSVNNDEVLEQTIRFAKNIVPVVIPPSSNDISPVYYTIKTSRKSRAGNMKQKSSAATPDTLRYKKHQEKKMIETFRKEKFKSQTESCSHESTGRSFLENIIISQSLNSTISEISEKRNRKTHRVDKRCNKTLFDASESLEALATELIHTSGEAKIKIHLMDDTAKDLFYESIRKPVIDAIKESVAEIQSKENSDSKFVQKYVQCHTQILDNILDKLTCIEKRLDGAEDKSNTRKARLTQKPSALEEIGEDMTEELEDECDGDVTVVYSAADKQKAKSNGAVSRFSTLQKIEEVSPNSGAGEEILGHKVLTPITSERPNRIPARYCWTDSTNQ